MEINFMYKKLHVSKGMNFISDMMKDPGYQFRQKMIKVHTKHFEHQNPLQKSKITSKPEKS